MGHERPEDFAALTNETKPEGSEETVADYRGFTSSIPPERHTEAWLTDKALEFLDGGRDEAKPFFLYLSFDFPHAPFNVPPGYEDLYAPGEIPPRHAPPDGADLAGHAGAQWRFWGEWLRDTTPPGRQGITLRYDTTCSYLQTPFRRGPDKPAER